MATTLKDVARESGVAVETVSRVLNNRGYISERTRKKVYDAMESIGYRPNLVARTLSKGRADIIAVIVPHIIHPYFTSMIDEIEHVAAAEDYQLLVYSSGGDALKEKKVLEACENNLVAGALIFSYNVNPSQMLEYHIPIVAIERYVEGGTSCVLCDNYQGGSLAAEHLISKGCRNLLMVGNVENHIMPANEREDGFLDACHKAKVSGIIYKTSIPEYQTMEYHACLERMFQDNPEADGIFCCSDMIAAQAIQVCRKIGYDVPGRMKIVGFDDTVIASVTTPTITTIRQPIKEMARMAVDMILKYNNKEKVPEKNIMNVELVERETT